MRIVYLGLPSGALALIRAGHRLAAVGLSRRSGAPEVRRRLDRTGAPLLYRPDPAAPPVRRLLASTGAPLLVCYLWDRLLPAAVIDAFAHGALSYHPSLLPRHRGPDPYFHTLWSGDQRAGVTVLRLDAGMDTGPVVAQRSIEVPPGIDAGELADRLDPLGLELLVEVLDRWDRHGPLPARTQDGALATDAPAPNDDLLEIRWSWPADRIARLVRAAAPHPGAFTFVGERLVIVLATRRHDLPDPRLLDPGDLLLLPEGPLIWTGEGGLLLDAIQLEGGPVLRDGREIARALAGDIDAP